MSLLFAADLVFAVLLYTYAIALAYAWRASRHAEASKRLGFRARLLVLDQQTRPATTVTCYLAISVVLGAVVGEQL